MRRIAASANLQYMQIRHRGQVSTFYVLCFINQYLVCVSYCICLIAIMVFKINNEENDP